MIVKLMFSVVFLALLIEVLPFPAAPVTKTVPRKKIMKNNGDCGDCVECNDTSIFDVEPGCRISCTDSISNFAPRARKTCKEGQFYNLMAEDCIHCSLCDKLITKKDKRKLGCHTSKRECRHKGRKRPQTECLPGQFSNSDIGPCIHCSVCAMFDDLYQEEIGCNQCVIRPTRRQQPRSQHTTMPSAVETFPREKNTIEGAATVSQQIYSTASHAQLEEQNKSEHHRGHGETETLDTNKSTVRHTQSEQFYTAMPFTTIGKIGNGETARGNASMKPIDEANYKSVISQDDNKVFILGITVAVESVVILVAAVFSICLFIWCKRRKNRSLPPSDDIEMGSLLAQDVDGQSDKQSNNTDTDDGSNAGDYGDRLVEEDADGNYGNDDRADYGDADDHDHGHDGNKRDNHHNNTNRDVNDGNDIEIDQQDHDYDGNRDNHHFDVIVAIEHDGGGEDDDDGDRQHRDDGNDDGGGDDGRPNEDNFPDGEGRNGVENCDNNGVRVSRADYDEKSTSGHQPYQDTEPPGSPPDDYRIPNDIQCAKPKNDEICHETTL
ncbi:uncharacterized protein [Ptychodera flava]|uniref:uncharacterized protein n=1 Tax=Ptychodera flava TaxID=63121 RepID=UPI00396A26F8